MPIDHANNVAKDISKNNACKLNRPRLSRISSRMTASDPQPHHIEMAIRSCPRPAAPVSIPANMARNSTQPPKLGTQNLMAAILPRMKKPATRAGYLAWPSHVGWQSLLLVGVADGF
jgi:hypothetical protein